MQDKVDGSDDEWVLAGEAAPKAKDLELTATRLSKTISCQSIFDPDIRPEEGGVENLCRLSSMDEPNILANLQRRFHSKLPYTSANDICIAVNPYTALEIYHEDTKQSYAVHPLNALPAHIFALSRASYDGMRQDRRNQSLLVSGESGAGKTESVKLLLDHIAFSAALHSGSSQKSQLFEKILKANPLLESFGNAKTSRNFNSSRFGKYVKLHFDQCAELQRSTCTTYLLEKSRAVNPPTGESNFHIFHELLAAPEGVHASLYLSGMTAADFGYTSEVVPSLTEHSMYAERFHHTNSAFQSVLGLSEEMIQSVLAVLASILYLGQLQLHAEDDTLNNYCSTNHSDSNGDRDDDSKGSHVLDDAALAVCASLLQVDPVQLHQSLTTRLLVSNNNNSSTSNSYNISHSIAVAGNNNTETIRTTLSRSQALLARDALAKEVYARLFAWIVQQVNASTHYDNKYSADESASADDSSECTPTTETSTNTTAINSIATSSLAERELTISLLDIFGFENFTSNTPSSSTKGGTTSHAMNCHNGFEQLCINYCNEKLQHMFTNDVIVAVQQEFAREGLMHAMNSDTTTSDTSSNDTIAVDATTIGVPVLRLFEHRAGLINLLNEECIVPGGCESTFLTKLFKCNAPSTSTSNSNNHTNSITTTTSLQAVPFSTTQFTVHHYAESVTYTTQSFIEKNRDTLPVLAAQLLATSGNSVLSTLFAASTSDATNNSYTTSGAGGLSVPIATSSNSNNHSNKKNKTSNNSNKRAPVTTMSKFRAQLDSLLLTVQATHCRYIRCLKPNSEKSSTVFDSQLVLQQLRSGGVVQAVRVSRAAYPHKLTHSECLQRYRNWWGYKTDTYQSTSANAVGDAGSEGEKIEEHQNKALSLKRACEELWQCADVVPILASASAQSTQSSQSSSHPLPVQVGHTMVYFAAGVLEALDKSKAEYLYRRIVPIQAIVRAYLQRKQYLMQLRRVVMVQAIVRRYLANRLYKSYLLSVVTVQQWWRVYLQRCKDRQLVVKVFHRWVNRWVYSSRVGEKLRALVQKAVQQQHQQQQQQQLLLQQQLDMVHLTSCIVVPTDKSFSSRPATTVSAAVSTHTQTDLSLLCSDYVSPSTYPCVCYHCGNDPRDPSSNNMSTNTYSYTNTNNQTITNSNSSNNLNTTSIITTDDNNSDNALATPTTATCPTITIHNSTTTTYCTIAGVSADLGMNSDTNDVAQPTQPSQQHSQASPLWPILHTTYQALVKEWNRSLLQDIQDSLDTRSVLILAVLAVLCSALW